MSATRFRSFERQGALVRDLAEAGFGQAENACGFGDVDPCGLSGVSGTFFNLGA